MTYEQYDTMCSLATHTRLCGERVFTDWLWNGGPEGHGLEADLKVLAYGVWCRLYREGVEREIGRIIASTAVSSLRKPPQRNSVVRKTQEGVRHLINLVESEPDPLFRHHTIDALFSPEYIFRDVARGVVVDMLQEMIPDLLRRIDKSPIGG